MKIKLDIGEVLDFAWDKVKVNFWKLAGVVLVSAFVQIAFKTAEKMGTGPMIIMVVCCILVSLVTSVGAMKVSLKIVRGQKFTFSEAFPVDWYELFQFLGICCAQGLIIFLGMMLLIVPGFVWLCKYLFAPYFVIDQKMGIEAALTASGKLTYGYKWQLAWFSLVFLGIIIAGLMAFGIGLLFGIPMIWISKAYIYEKLRSATAERVESTMFVQRDQITNVTEQSS